MGLTIRPTWRTAGSRGAHGASVGLIVAGAERRMRAIRFEASA